jgi:hypothetical protein
VAAPSSGSEEYDTDPAREASAYNNSIYLMVATPYLLLGAFGFYVYRGLKKNEAARAAARGPGTEGLSCPLPSTAANSSPAALPPASPPASATSPSSITCRPSAPPTRS